MLRFRETCRKCEMAKSTTLSNIDEFKLIHLDLHWDIDFGEKQIIGIGIYEVEAVQSSSTIILDTNKVEVSSVSLLDEQSSNPINLDFELKPEHNIFGSALHISLPSTPSQGDTLTISISYKTGKGDVCSALQWLPAEQTKDKKHGFMFSQCQAIHARSLYPAFDTPAVKFTYSATITTPIICTALCSGLEKKKSYKDRVLLDHSEKKVFYYEQPIPIPSYLVAVCVGVLDSKEISRRCKVWSEPSMVEECAWEFAQTEDYLKTAEDLLGPYEWGRYDLLVLPPSFPYGGMENPCLTFVTPTLIAKDRSLVNVVAHEITHSWTGNLVTNESWDCFWMNEGFTRFCEGKIMAKIDSKESNICISFFAEEEAFGFIFLLSRDTLKQTVDTLGENNPFTCLYIDHSASGGIDPDDAFSSIPYEKGAAFLTYLQNIFGGPAIFDPILREYIASFKLKTVTPDSFKEFLESKNIEVMQQVDWHTWLKVPGLPKSFPNDNVLDRTIYEKCAASGSGWISGSLESLEGLTTDMILVAINSFGDGINGLEGEERKNLIRKVEDAYGFSKKENAEIKFAWLHLCIGNNVESDLVKEETESFLGKVGRMKFTRPLYRAMYKVGGNYRDFAIELFQRFKTRYHAICQKMVAKDLGLE
eukprot:snap_masked-scaffold_33-processed-gene-3.1-mRNA-1 protein AED:0.25 eAED:0.25 QI:45/0.66/0.75/1/1/1/4/98/645